MIFNSLTRATEDLAAARSFLAANTKLRAILGSHEQSLEPDFLSHELNEVSLIAPDATGWRVQDHCAAVSRIYAIFEKYCESVLADWIAFRVDGCCYNELPEKMITAYPEGVLTVLGSIKHVRYSHLSEKDIISEYNSALNGSNNFRIAPECLTYHRNNLRLPDVIEIFERSGIKNCESWLANHPALSHHFQTNKKLSEQAASKLLDFIKYRNDAAHGSVVVDEILSHNEIESFCDFIYSLIVALDELVSSNTVEWLEQKGKASKIGLITESLSNNIVIANLEGVTIRSGESLFIKNSKSCIFRKIESIRVNDNDVNELVIANAMEVGLRFNGPTLKRSTVFSIDADK